MVSISFRFQPSIDITESEIYSLKVFRKADLDDPTLSYAVKDFVEYATIATTDRKYTDANGDPDFLYAIETANEEYAAPLGPVIPGHGNYTFAKLTAGRGLLSNLGVNSVDEVEMFHEETEATAAMIDTYLLDTRNLSEIWEIRKHPFPQLRTMTALLASTNLLSKYRPHDTEQIKLYMEKFDDLVDKFMAKGVQLTQDFEVESNTVTDQELRARTRQKWGR